MSNKFMLEEQQLIVTENENGTKIADIVKMLNDRFETGRIYQSVRAAIKTSKWYDTVKEELAGRGTVDNFIENGSPDYLASDPAPTTEANPDTDEKADTVVEEESEVVVEEEPMVAIEEEPEVAIDEESEAEEPETIPVNDLFDDKEDEPVEADEPDEVNEPVSTEDVAAEVIPF